MRFRRILVVYKKSSYDVYALERKDRHFLKLVRRRDALVEKFLRAHRTHYASLEAVRKILSRRGVLAEFTYRAADFSEKGFDFVISVGGDGTFLEASHRVERAPILGVNSNPEHSVGLFCGTTADQLDSALDGIESGKLRKTSFSRLAVEVGGDQLPMYAINDVLVAHSNPASTSRYVLEFRKKREEQKSSGIWIASAAGSTAAIHSAGGRWMPSRSRSFQFVVRELYVRPGAEPRLRGGVARSGERLAIRSKMRNGRIYIDGPHISKEFHLGQSIVITADAPRLDVFGFSEKRRKMFR